ncbi:unnamed protein product [Peronospora belbahrii]|uniref:RNase NYN domain-containing protein n=1 Tax=Peronospora belbahrii TaxID=622444 RepID=A0AAU9KR92_9STRA|nr:unnamed protein product [Peronospora belbahrii]
MTSIKECVIVIDGANVACQKGGKAHIPNLVAAIQFFQSLKPAVGRFPIKCVAFIPNFWLNVKPVSDSVKSRENGIMETDEWLLLNNLVEKNYVVLTPSQAHDDFYVIDYAVKHDGFIVTNDMFRDHVSNKRSFHGRKLTSSWVRSHCIDFTFVGKEFLPNPRAMERIFNFQPLTIDSNLSFASSCVSVSTSNPAILPHTSLQVTFSKDENDQEGTHDDVDEDGMVVDHPGIKRNKTIDLSEVTYYKVPRQLLPLLHGQDGETMEKFQEYTGTYIVLPSHAVLESPSVRLTSNMLTLSIYGPEASRQQAVGHLDAFLLEMQEKQDPRRMSSQAYHTVIASQHQRQYVAAEENMPPQDDQMMEIDS